MLRSWAIGFICATHLEEKRLQTRSEVSHQAMSTEVPWASVDIDNFNPMTFVNSIFPSEESLDQIDRVSKALREKISQLDIEMSEAVRKQSISRSKGKEQLLKAHSSIDVCIYFLLHLSLHYQGFTCQNSRD